MFLKIIGCILLICGTTGYGYGKSAEYRRYIQELERLKRVIWHLKGELSYTRAALAEVCKKVAKRVEDPYRFWLISMEAAIKRKGYTNLGRLWEEETKLHLAGAGLKKTELEELANLGHQMGYLNLSRQEEILRWYGERLEEIRKNKLEKMEEKCRLCNCLGVMTGIFLSILLL